MEYEQGNVDEAMEKWQSVLEIDAEQAEPTLALAVAFYARGEVERGIELGKAALAIDDRYAELEFLRENLWGERLLEDTKEFLNTPQMQAVLRGDRERLPLTEANPLP